MNKAIAILLALAVMAIGPAGANPGPPKGPVTVTLIKEPVRIDDSLSHRKIRSRWQCQHPGAEGLYLGLSMATVGTRLRYQVFLQRVAGGVAGGVASVDIELSLSDRTVYIAKELPADSCPYGETRKHEMRHVAIDDDALRQFRIRLQRRMQQKVAEMGMIRGRDQTRVVAGIRAALETALDAEMAFLEQTRQSRHAAFDSVDEYNRMTNICNGQARRYVRRFSPDDGGWYEPADCDAPGTSPAPS